MEAGRLTGAKLDAVNAALLGMRGDWLSEGAQPEREWFRNLFVATDEDSGYAAWMLPGLRWAVEHDAVHDDGRVKGMVGVYVKAFEGMEKRMGEMAEGLERPE